MVERALRIVRPGFGKVCLPAAVGLPAVGQVAFEPQPAVRAREGDVVADFGPHLRNGPGPRAFHHHARAEVLGLFEREARPLLAANAQAELAPSHVGIGLLDDERGALVPRAGQLEPGLHAPVAPQGLAIRHAGPQAGKLVVDAREAVAVGRQPQRGILAAAGHAERFDAVAQAGLRRVGLLPARRTVRTQGGQREKDGQMFLHQTVSLTRQSYCKKRERPSENNFNVSAPCRPPGPAGPSAGRRWARGL